MNPIIPLCWLSLWFALTLPDLHALPITNQTQPNGSSDTQGNLTSISPSNTSHPNQTMEKHIPQTENRGKNATTTTPRGTYTPTTAAVNSSMTQVTKTTSTTAKSSTTEKADQSKTSTKLTSTQKTAANEKAHEDSRGGVGIAVKLLIILVVLLLVFVIGFRWLIRQTGPAGDAARRCSRGLQERLRSVVAAMERCLGLSLWPRKRMENEDAGEEEEMNGSNGTAGGGKAQKGGEDEDEEEEEEEDQKGEEGDSSDDYSSLEGMDLRERAKQQDDEEMPGERESKTEGAEEDLTSITLGEENKEGAEEDDVTEL